MASGSGKDEPFRPLLDAHAVCLEKLGELEATLDEMMARREATDADRGVPHEHLRLFHGELLPHLTLEDEIVLPALEAKIGRFGTLVNVIAYEHAEIRREVGKFEEALEGLHGGRDAGPAIEELNRHGIFTIQFLWDHFRKEKASLFPTAVAELSTEALQRIRDALGGRA